MRHGRLLHFAERPAREHVLPRRRVVGGSHGAEFVQIRDVGLRERRTAVLIRLVPDERQDSAAPQYPCDLRDRFVVRKPVERLACEDPVNGRSRQWDGLSAARHAVGGGHHALEDRTHLVERLNSDHAAVTLREHARQLPRACSEIEDLGIGCQGQVVQQPGWIVRASALVLLRSAVETAGGRRLSQRRRAERRAAP